MTGLSRTLPLVFTAGFPFNLWVSSDLRKIQLRTIGGRRRSYDAVRRPLPSSQAQPRARKYSPRRSPRGSRRSPQQELSAAQRARTGRISKWPRDVGIGKSTRDGRIRTLEPVGLHNQAGVCYRRSLMQCLLHVPALYNYFEAVHKECEYSEETCLTCAVKVLFDTYWNDREDTFPRGKRGKVVREFDRAVRYNSGRSAHFRKLGDDNVHNDVHDFLQFLLEVLVEEDPES